MEQQDGLVISARVREVMANRDVRMRDFVQRLPHRHLGTAYRLLSGKTTDPSTGTLVDVCRVLVIEPDELLGTVPPPLPADLQEMLDAARGLSDDDKWIVVDVLRAVLRGRDGHRGEGHVVG